MNIYLNLLGFKSVLRCAGMLYYRLLCFFKGRPHSLFTKKVNSIALSASNYKIIQTIDSVDER